MPERMRADRLLVARGLFESRARAQSAIAAGLVTADGLPVRKASDELATGARIEARAEHPFVSRGGVKLAAALDHFAIDPHNCICLDVGASTGGFTDVLLARGARHVIAVDVGRDQLHPRLRDRADVTVREGTDIRALDPASLPHPPDLVGIDVSFISLTLVLPAATHLAAREAALVALIKPQFEAGRAHLKKGILRDPAVQANVCAAIADRAAELGWQMLGVIPSPILGGSGNREFLVGLRR